MNTYQAPKIEDIEQRRLPARELRPHAILTLSARSPKDATLPSRVGQCVGGSYAVVERVETFGDMLKVVTRHSRAPHPTGRQIFIIEPTAEVLVRMPKTEPVPHTPYQWAKLMGIAK